MGNAEGLKYISRSRVKREEIWRANISGTWKNQKQKLGKLQTPRKERNSTGWC